MQTAAGVAVALISFALVILARLQRGRSFSIAPKAVAIVTHGLYSRLQHPMYLFVDLAICGITLALHRWWVLLPLLLLLPLQVKNARAERSILRKTFAERYETYRSATWF
jgi:protein-S-isoprenylcysteine O-methyltransferase Ste14